MVKISDTIYKYYTKELNLFELAYGNKKAKLLNSIIIITSVLYGIYYFYNFRFAKAVILFILSGLFIVFIEYTRYIVIKKYNKFVENYNLKETERDVSKIIITLLVEQIDEYGLLNRSGIDYLIKVYIKKSEKHKIKDIAIGVILLTTVIGKLGDFFFDATQKDIDRLTQIFTYVKSNLTDFIAIAVMLLVGILLIRYCIVATIAYFLNRKSNNYKKLSELLDETIMPQIIRYEASKINSDSLKENILRFIYGDSYEIKEMLNKQTKKKEDLKKTKRAILENGKSIRARSIK